MYTAIDAKTLDRALSDFAELVKEKTYKKFEYSKWKEFTSKFKGKCIEIEGDEFGIELHTNDRKSMLLDPCDNSLGTFIWDEFCEEDYWCQTPAPGAFGKDLMAVKCKIASSEVNKNMTKISPDAIGMRLKKPDGTWVEVDPADVTFQSTSSSCYPVKNYKLHDLDAANLNMDCSLKTPIDKIFKKEEDNNMKGFNFDFGPCSNDNIRMSMYGLAVQNNAGIWVSYNKGSIVDVDVFNFDGRQYMFKMPVAIKDIKVGDIVIHNRVPMFVTSTEGGSISAVDVRAGEAKTIIPTTNMFGFNFVTKIVSMFDAFTGAPTADQPFGNMLPFIMMGENKDIDPMMMFMMMNQGGAGFDMSNPMMLYFMFGKDGKSSDWMLPMMMMNMQNGKHECHCNHHE